MPNAVEMLREDHRKVQELFQQFEHGDEEAKEQIAAQTIQELEVHTALEEEIFYPAAREESDKEETVDQALEEHHVAKLLLAELKKMSPGDKRYDAKYKVLAESVKHHIQEEESEMLPSIEGSLDAEKVGQQMATRKEKLQQKFSNASGARRSKSRSKTTARRGKKQSSGKKRRRASGSRR
ncbi:MAG TPA: hemerythrin domain-containing protein [Candidatus Udaeobacter sp.]|jgi:hemerythrin-like domain-containing protein|nr:hemerythrin domain-containing protein [Candidatus Udaeobacter sp.]